MNMKVKIIRSDRKTLSIIVELNEIIARAPMQMSEEEIYKFIESQKEWINATHTRINERQKILDELRPYTQEEIKQFKEKAKLHIPKRVEYYAKLLGVSYNKVTIKCQRGRFGSCSSLGNLNFNCILMLFSDEIIDSVVVHEVCHLKHMNHSARFYAEVEKLLPNYQYCHIWLNQNGGIYLDRIPR